MKGDKMFQYNTLRLVSVVQSIMFQLKSINLIKNYF